jgi:hypothetical protein
VGTTSPAVCAFPRELLWSGWCWFLVQLMKNFIAPVALLFRHCVFPHLKYWPWNPCGTTTYGSRFLNNLQVLHTTVVMV